MLTSSGTGVHLHRCQPGFVRPVHTLQLDTCPLVLLLLPTLSFLVSPLATVPALASKIRYRPSTCFLSTHCSLFLLLLFSLPFPFLLFLPFPFVPFTCPMSIGPDVSGAMCRPRSSWVVGSLRQSPHSHVSTQGLVRLTICQENHFLEITVGCCRVLRHSRYLDRLLEVCTCGNSALCNVFLPGSKHVTKVASLAVRLLPSGTWVEDTSQEPCCPVSTFALILFLEDSPRFQSKVSGNQRYQSESLAFAPHDEQGMNCFASCDTVRVQTIIRDEGCLFCSDVQMCSHVCQVRMRLKFHSPTFPVSVMLQVSRGQILSHHWITTNGNNSAMSRLRYSD